MMHKPGYAVSVPAVARDATPEITTVLLNKPGFADAGEKEGHPFRGNQYSGGGYVAARIGKYRIIEGTGVQGGNWIAKGPGDIMVFKTRRQAEEHAKLSQEMDE